MSKEDAVNKAKKEIHSSRLEDKMQLDAGFFNAGLLCAYLDSFFQKEGVLRSISI